jgi:hypothetical protein
MSKIFQIMLDGEGQLDGQITTYLHDMVDAYITETDYPTIGGLAKSLEIHFQRASRLVHRLGLRDKFAQGA